MNKIMRALHWLFATGSTTMIPPGTEMGFSIAEKLEDIWKHEGLIAPVNGRIRLS